MGVNVYDEGIYVLTEYLKYLSIRQCGWLWINLVG